MFEYIVLLGFIYILWVIKSNRSDPIGLKRDMYSLMSRHTGTEPLVAKASLPLHIHTHHIPNQQSSPYNRSELVLGHDPDMIR
jgi:hypothetical protein